ncbi:hypothetical protein HPB51_004404 [Rhipicephalus microplus]|uniref:non-specific serine/threonine protein kinase n=1 Tax=Rhipicephalus microplus TaxID=6941 RepID=A0A9J6EKY4_RHIMP|nr:hypothetical protein HPB51_004404 [Rhipicephalus microplus]
MASGDLLLELPEKHHYEKLGSLKAFGNIPVSVSPHRSMNTSRGVVSEADLLEMSEEELLEGWKEQNVTDGVKHLHDRHLVHLDIKPENIFISREGYYKLGDFGLVLDLKQDDSSDPLEGDPCYLAPELMGGDFTKAADIFSLGITALELACDLELPSRGGNWHALRSGTLPHYIAQYRLCPGPAAADLILDAVIPSICLEGSSILPQKFHHILPFQCLLFDVGPQRLPLFRWLHSAIKPVPFNLSANDATVKKLFPADDEVMSSSGDDSL